MAPRWRPRLTAASPTPPPAPRTTSSSPGCSRATERRTWYAVRQATPKAAAWRSSTPGGTARTAAAATATSSAKAPTITVPDHPVADRHPVDPVGHLGRPRPTNSLPGHERGRHGDLVLVGDEQDVGEVDGGGAASATRTCPSPSSGDGTSSTATTSGAP